MSINHENENDFIFHLIDQMKPNTAGMFTYSLTILIFYLLILIIFLYSLLNFTRHSLIGSYL